MVNEIEKRREEVKKFLEAAKMEGKVVIYMDTDSIAIAHKKDAQNVLRRTIESENETE